MSGGWLSRTRREYVLVGLTAASMLQTVLESQPPNTLYTLEERCRFLLQRYQRSHAAGLAVAAVGIKTLRIADGAQAAAIY